MNVGYEREESKVTEVFGLKNQWVGAAIDCNELSARTVGFTFRVCL